MDKILQHYGVLGMKWGVRKDRYKDYYDKDTTLKKGSKLNVTTSGKEADTNRKYTYASRTDNDTNFYNSYMAKGLKYYNGKDTKVYSNNFVIKKDIKIPSQRTAANTFLKIYNDDPKGTTSAIATSLAARRRTSDMGKIKIFMLDRQEKKIYQDVYKTFSRNARRGKEWLEHDGFQYFNFSLVDNKNQARDKYFNLLYKQGYGGVRDTNDINDDRAEDPLIIFNPSSTLSKTGTHELTERDIELAKAKYDYEKSKVER